MNNVLALLDKQLYTVKARLDEVNAQKLILKEEYDNLTTVIHMIQEQTLVIIYTK
jgi:hypothetical protein